MSDDEPVHTDPALLASAYASVSETLLPLSVDECIEFSDPRLQAVAAKLTERERRILHARSYERGWRDAAVSVGETPAAGDNVRRKVNRIVAAAAGNSASSGLRGILPGSTAQVSA